MAARDVDGTVVEGTRRLWLGEGRRRYKRACGRAAGAVRRQDGAGRGGERGEERRSGSNGREGFVSQRSGGAGRTAGIDPPGN